MSNYAIAISIEADGSAAIQAVRSVGDAAQQAGKSAATASTGVDQFGQSSRTASTDAAQLGRTATRTATEAGQVGKSAASASTGVDWLGRTTRTAATGVQQLGGTAVSSSTGVNALGQTTRTAATGAQQLGGTAARVVVEVRQVGQAGSTASQGVDQLGRSSAKTEGELQRMSRTAQTVRNFLATVFGAVVIRDALLTTMQIEGMRRTLEGVMGSGQQAAAGIAFVRAEADRLGVAFIPALDGYTKLVAAAAGTPLAARVNELSGAVLQAGRAFNLSGEQVGGAITAIEQMISKGTVTAEELAGQLGERIPGAVGIAARAMGVTTGELRKMMETGSVVASDFLPKFAAELRNATASAAELNANSPSAEIARIRNALQDIMVDFGEGMFSGMGDALAEMRDKLRSIDASDIAKEIGQAVGAVVGQVSTLVTHLDTAAVGITAFVGLRGLGALLNGLRSLGVVAALAPPAIRAAGAAFAGLTLPTVGATSAVAGFSRVAGVATVVGRGLLAMLGGWAGAAALAVTGAYYVAQAMKDTDTAANRLTDTLAALKAAQNGMVDLDTGSKTLASIREQIAELERLEQTKLKYRDSPMFGSMPMAALKQDFDEVHRNLNKLREEAEKTHPSIKVVFDLFQGAYSASDVVRMLTGSMRELREETARNSGEAAKFYARLKQETEEFGKSRAALVRMRAAKEAAAAGNKFLADSIIQQAEALARLIEGEEAAKKAEESRKKAQREQEQAFRNRGGLLKALRQANIELRNAELEVAEAERRRSAGVRAVLADFEREIQLLTLTGAARETYIRQLMFEDAVRQAGGVLNAEEEAQLRRLIDLQRDLSKAKEEATEATRVWQGAMQGWSQAFGDLLTGQLSSFKDFADAIKKIWLRAVSDMIAQQAQGGLNNLFGGLMSGGAPGGAAGGGGIAGMLGNFNLRGAVSGSGMGTALFGVPVIGWIAAAMQMNNSLFAQGWRPGEGDKPAGGAYYALATLTPTAMVSTFADRLLRGLGVGASTASWLTGSAVVQRLFGRKAPELQSSETQFSFGPQGATGSNQLRILERGGVFRSDRRSTRTEGLSDDASAAMRELFDSLSAVVRDASQALRSEAPSLLSSALRMVAEYDKEGKVKSTRYFVDVLGRTWEEATAELAQDRLTAENIIAAIDSVLGTTATAVATASADVVDGFVGGIADGFNDGMLEARHHIKSGVAAMVQGEASAIAEAWRGDAAKLLDGARMLLGAAVDMRRGVALITDGSLTEIAGVVQSLAGAGEGLADAYARLWSSTQLITEALGIFNGAMVTSTAEVVAFADAAVSALGGLDAAAAQINAVLNAFFTDAERAAFRLVETQRRADQEMANLGVSGVSYETYRGQFEAARAAGLSGEEFAAWIRLGVALAENAEAARILAGDTEELATAQSEAAEAARMAEMRQRQLIEAMMALAEHNAGVQQSLESLRREGMDQFVAGIDEVHGWLADSTEQAHSLARAAGYQGASVETLTALQEMAAIRIGRAYLELERQTASLVDSLYALADAEEEQIYWHIYNLDAIIRQQERAASVTAALDPQRFEQAMQVARNLFNLGWARGEDPLDMAERLGVPFERFLRDLGVDLAALSDETSFDRLVAAARTLGVEVPELAARVGIALGDLWDAASMLNDGFERTLSRLSEDQRTPIEALLRQLEGAPESGRQALLAQLGELVNSLPAELRALFAPFLDDVDITPPEQEQINATSRVQSAVEAGNTLLSRILAAIEAANPMYAGPGKFPGEKLSPASERLDLSPVTAAVTRSGDGMRASLATATTAISHVERATLAVRDEVRALGNELRRSQEQASTGGLKRR